MEGLLHAGREVEGALAGVRLRAGGRPPASAHHPFNWAACVAFFQSPVRRCLILFLFLSELTGFITTEM